MSVVLFVMLLLLLFRLHNDSLLLSLNEYALLGQHVLADCFI